MLEILVDCQHEKKNAAATSMGGTTQTPSLRLDATDLMSQISFPTELSNQDMSGDRGTLALTRRPRAPVVCSSSPLRSTHAVNIASR